jgi:primosomal protein N' (replication factor Y) (superfamily II helicase)
MQYVDLILPIGIGRTFTYGVPIEMQTQIQVGMRVEVVFGKSNIYTAVVMHLHNNKPTSYIVKPITSIIDDKPLLSKMHLKFWEWMATYYMCAYGDVMNAALPNYMKLSSETVIVINPEINSDDFRLSDAAFRLMEHLRIVGEVNIKEAEAIIKNNVKRVINELIYHECIFTYTNAKEKFNPKKESVVTLSDEYDNEEAMHLLFNELEKAPKQMHLLMAYLQLSAENIIVAQKTLLKQANATAAQLNALINKGVLLKDARVVSRLKIKPTKNYEAFTLSTAQQKAFVAIQLKLAEVGKVLLHGVTGSGKTNIHIALAKQYLSAGKQVLYLLPEIALTIQVINKLYSEFGDKVLVYHSKYSNNERAETWQKIQSGEPLILIGARSSVLLPYHNLGLIVIDEEHDASYKQQDPAPRYSGRDSALMLAHLCEAKVLLSSATPSVQSIFNVQQKKYAYVALNERYGKVSLPTIEIVRNEKLPDVKRMSNILSDELIDAIKATLEQRQQVIIFQNRRGFAPYLYCADCGWNARCTNCDVSLNYHKATDKLHCHYCGAHEPVFKSCKRCSSVKVYFKNYGTERVEEELQKVFPSVKIDRLDTDAIRTKNKYQKLIEQIESKETQILVGTQLLSKGLDFDDVQLIGIIHVDSLWTHSDYNSNERAFQLLLQLSGRAGRKGNASKMIIQCLDSTHPLLSLLQDYNFTGFIKQELLYRKEWNLPPFSKMIKIYVKHRVEQRAAMIAEIICMSLKDWQNISILGPVAPLVSKINNWYIQELIIKLPLNTSYNEQVKQRIQLLMEQIKQQKGNSGAILYAEVDP